MCRIRLSERRNRDLANIMGTSVTLAPAEGNSQKSEVRSPKTEDKCTSLI